jgi:hypothetical protein
VLFENETIHDLGTLDGADGDAWGINASGLDPAPPPAAPARAVAIEYYYPAFDHYFVTAIPAEISALGRLWRRRRQHVLAGVMTA